MALSPGDQALSPTLRSAPAAVPSLCPLVSPTQPLPAACRLPPGPPAGSPPSLSTSVLCNGRHICSGPQAPGEMVPAGLTHPSWGWRGRGLHRQGGEGRHSRLSLGIRPQLPVPWRFQPGGTCSLLFAGTLLPEGVSWTLLRASHSTWVGARATLGSLGAGRGHGPCGLTPVLGPGLLPASWEADGVPWEGA